MVLAGAAIKAIGLVLGKELMKSIGQNLIKQLMESAITSPTAKRLSKNVKTFLDQVGL